MSSPGSDGPIDNEDLEQEVIEILAVVAELERQRSPSSRARSLGRPASNCNVSRS